MIRFIISLLLPRNTPPAAGMNLGDHTRSLVIYMPPAVRSSRHGLLHGDIDPSPAADIHITLLHLQIISMQGTTTAGPGLQMAGFPGNGRTGSASLLDPQVFRLHFPRKRRPAGKIHG